jgi:hypothetical protein
MVSIGPKGKTKTKQKTMAVCVATDGSDDRFVRTENAALLHDMLLDSDSDSELLIVENMGHSLDAENCASMCAAMMRTFGRADASGGEVTPAPTRSRL